jgi:uncharacterized membrane protein (UPF0136 family)
VHIASSVTMLAPPLQSRRDSADRAAARAQAVAGLGLGALFAYAGSLITRGEIPCGYQVASGASVLTGTAMAIRYNKTRKLVPAGVLAPLALVSAAYHAWKGSGA